MPTTTLYTTLNIKLYIINIYYTLFKEGIFYIHMITF